MPDDKTVQILVDKARQSTLFTAPVLGLDLERFLNEQAVAIKELAAMALREKVEHIYWVGSGNSWLNLYSGKLLIDRYTPIPSDCLVSYDLIWRNPVSLDHNAWAFFASYSGATEDTVAALRHARSRGAFTIAIVNSESSLMAQEADAVIAYHSKALYILPLAAAYLFALELARFLGSQEAEGIISGLYTLPALLKRQYIDEEEPAKQLAQKFCDEQLFYVLASGPLYGLGYKFGLTVFMENMRVHGSFMDASEFRHGPTEMLDRYKPAIVILKGLDESRALVERVQQLARQNGARVICYDAADYGAFHPMLAPFVLMIPLQWFAVYSAILRGIEDLDERVLMGRGIMGQGKGITWP